MYTLFFAQWALVVVGFLDALIIVIITTKMSSNQQEI